MKVDKVDEVSIARGVFVSSFAVFIFTALFASAAAGSGLLGGDLTATAYYSNSANKQFSQKLAIAKAPLQRNMGDEGGSVDIGTGGGDSGGSTGSGGGTTAGDVVSPSAPTVTITVSPESVKYGGEAHVKWTSTNALSCEIKSATAPVLAPVAVTDLSKKSVAGQAAMVGKNTSSAAVKSVERSFARAMKSTAPEGMPTGALYADTTYTATCKGVNNTVGTASATVKVEAPVAPTVSIAADPAKVGYDKTTKISWTSENAKSCKVTTGQDVELLQKYNIAQKNMVNVGGIKVFATGLSNVGKETARLKSSIVYTVTCIGEGNTTASADAAVEVETPAKPVVTISAKPETVEYNGASMISWTSANATKCNVKKDTANFAGQMTNEGMSSGKLKKTTKFSVECTGIGGTETASVDVVVNPAVRPTAKISVDASEVAMNGAVKVSWTSTGAELCKVSKNMGHFAAGIEGKDVASQALSESSVFWITCISEGGTAVDSVSVQVRPVVVPEMSAAAKSVGGSASGTVRMGASANLKENVLPQRSTGTVREAFTKPTAPQVNARD